MDGRQSAGRPDGQPENILFSIGVARGVHWVHVHHQSGEKKIGGQIYREKL